MENGRTQDTLLTAKNTIRKKDSKGRDVLKIYLNQEEAEAALQELQTALASSEGRGINLTFHTGKKEYEGRSFDSTFYFVKATQEKGAIGAGSGGQKKNFVPRQAPAPKQVG